MNDVKPIIAINAKTYYPYSFGSHLLRILRALERVSEEYDVRVILAPPHTELKESAEISRNVEIYAQHIDPLEPGAHTGSVILEGIKEFIKGSIVNHSEKQLKLSEIEFIINKLNQNRLGSIACAPNPSSAAAISILKPEMVAMEPPELIGTGISVSRAKPETITETVKMVREAGFEGPILVGAGISTGEDVRKALELGAQGVLVASAVVKAEDPLKKLEEFAGAAVGTK